MLLLKPHCLTYSYPWSKGLFKIILLPFLLFLSLNLLAWNKAGHMISASIAFQILKQQDPGTIRKVVDLLKYNPLYSQLWTSQIDPANIDESLFMLASTWPDDVRNAKYSSKYSHPDWHYINMPYYSKSKNSNTNAIPLHPINILSALEQNMKTLRNGTKQEKAIALCWIIHLYGDIHQPLHTISLINKDFTLPNGDKGGNKFYFKTCTSKKGKKLHVFWDDLILNSHNFSSIKKKSKAFMPTKAPLDKSSKSIPLTFKEIVNESYLIAVHDVYLNGNLAYSLKPKAASLAPAYYKINSKAVAQQRVLLAGTRLALFLEMLSKQKIL